jgi:hypothetical protein
MIHIFQELLFLFITRDARFPDQDCKNGKSKGKKKSYEMILKLFQLKTFGSFFELIACLVSGDEMIYLEKNIYAEGRFTASIE